MRTCFLHTGLVLLAACLFGLAILAQPSGTGNGQITEINIDGLVPFQVSFDFQNKGDAPLVDVFGLATLLNQSGNLVKQLRVDPFSVPAGQSVLVTAASRWEFQQPGVYLLDVSLDIGLESLVSEWLPFRIAPVYLPLAPPADLEVERFYTVSQQPVNWGLSRIDVPQAWQTTHGDKDIVVAVIDSGIDTSIPQLATSMWVNEDEIPDNGVDDDRNGYVDDLHGWDFRDNDNSSLLGSKLHWHGTFVATIIAAWPAENGIVGVAPGVKLMDVRFLDSKNIFYGRDWPTFAEAINYAVDNGADIINISIYATGKPPRAFDAALRQALKGGVIIVGITGNDGEAQVSYPGRFDSVLAVSATDKDDRLARFSNYGAEVFVAAPGHKVVSLIAGGLPATKSSGTSFAAPHVAGLLALILSANPSLTPAEAVEVLQQTTFKVGSEEQNPQFGHGLINANSAVGAAKQ